MGAGGFRHLARGVGGRVTGFVAVHLPRLISLAWALWVIPTAFAYVDGSPPQLVSAEALLMLPIWVVWALAAALLVLGSLVPPGASERQLEAARWMRVVGLAICAGLLIMWGAAFLGADGGRGWVSAKNYLFMALAAIVSAYLSGRDRARVRGQNA